MITLQKMKNFHKDDNSAWQTLVTNLGFKAIPSHANKEAYKQYMGQPYNFLKLKIHIGQHLVLCLTKIDQEA